MDNNYFNNDENNNQNQQNDQNSQDTTEQNNGVNENQNEPQSNGYKNPYTQGGRYSDPFSNSNYYGQNNNYNQSERENVYSHNSSGSNNGYNNYNGYNNGNNYSNGFSENSFDDDEKNKKDRRGLGIASMILGIVSIVLCCTFWISLIASIVGLVLGIISMVKKRNGFALAGIITSSFGLALSLLILVLSLVGEFFIYEYPDGFPIPGDSSGHDFSIKRVLLSVKNFLGKK